MARPSSSWKTLIFNSLSPWRFLLVISLLANVAMAAALWYLNSSDGDVTVFNTAVSHVCNRDYNAMQAQLSGTDLDRLCDTTAQSGR